MNEEEFAAVLALGHELSGVEFKGPGPASANHLFARVVKAVLAMANRRDGGWVIIGVNDKGGVLDRVGLSESDRNTWKHDDVAAKLAEYADPSIGFGLEHHDNEGKHYTCLHVPEFDDIPVLCKKDYNGVLHKGKCYVRSRRKPESTEIPTQEDMRDLLDLAAEKRLRKYLELARRAGGEIIPLDSSAVTPSAEQLYEAQLGDLR